MLNSYQRGPKIIVHGLVASAIGGIWGRALSGEAAQETVTRVNAAVFTPQALSVSLNEFESILAHEEVQKRPEVMEMNHNSFRSLLHFLKGYTKGLRKDEPLQQQLHTLEFVVPNQEDPPSLRRLVVKVGTPGGSNGHKIVSRCIQGLFREVGLSPNFLWDEVFEIPERYMTHEQQKRIDNAALDAKVKQIQAVQRGEQLPADSTLSMIDSQDHLPDASNSGAATATGGVQIAATSAPRDVADEEEEADADDDALEDIESVAADLDEKLRVLAMSPWIRVYGELRAEEEKRTANELIMFMNGMLPGFGGIVPQVWAGGADAQVLAEQLSEGQPDDIKPMISACVQQICECFEVLLDQHGEPDQSNAVSRKLLVKTTDPVAVATQQAREMA